MRGGALVMGGREGRGVDGLILVGGPVVSKRGCNGRMFGVLR